MLKIYTNQTFLLEKYRKQVFPLLFDIVFYKPEKISKYYSLVSSIKECDIVVSPLDYNFFNKKSQLFLELQKEAQKADRPFWIYSGGDYGYTNNFDNVYTFRLGGFKSKLSENTFILPSFVSDPYKVLEREFDVIHKKTLPQIGFVGHADSSLYKYIKELVLYCKKRIKAYSTKVEVDHQYFYPSGYIRGNYLNSIKSNTGIKSNFIFRKHYRAGIKNKKNESKTRLEFYNNMYNNPYTFCMRGEGNFSVRFYETLAMGRIPILLDTDCKLPLDTLINWSKHCLILRQHSTKSLSTQIINFHNSIDVEHFKEIQISNRKLWLNLLRREAFFIAIYSLMKNVLSNEV